MCCQEGVQRLLQWRMQPGVRNILVMAACWFMPVAFWQCFVHFKSKHMKFCLVKKLPKDWQTRLPVSVVVYEHPIFCGPRCLRPGIHFKCIQFVDAKVRRIAEPVRCEYTYWLMYDLAVLPVVVPHILFAGVQLQIINGRPKLRVDDIEVSAAWPVVPKVKQSQRSRPVLKEGCVKLIGPNWRLWICCCYHTAYCSKSSQKHKARHGHDYAAQSRDPTDRLLAL